MADEPEIALAAIEATARAVRLPVGLVFDRVTLNGEGLSFAIDPFVPAVSEPVQIEAEIGEESLARFLNRIAPGGLEGFHVQLQGGKATVDAVKRMLVSVPARAICSVRIEEGTRLYVDFEDVAMFGGNVKGMVQKQMEHVNPILDVTDWPWEVTLIEAVIAGGKLILRGTAVPVRRSEREQRESGTSPC